MLIEKGKIRSYGWSTDSLREAALFAENKNCSAIQHQHNLLFNAKDMVQLCERKKLASINRSPLAMGFLSGKFRKDSFLSKDDVRGAGHSWTEDVFKDGKPNPAVIEKLDAVRDILTCKGRTLVQGSLGWIWAVSEATIPIPGFKNAAQVEENAKAMEYGPLTAKQMEEIDRILNKSI